MSDGQFGWVVSALFLGLMLGNCAGDTSARYNAAHSGGFAAPERGEAYRCTLTEQQK